MQEENEKKLLTFCHRLQLTRRKPVPDRHGFQVVIRRVEQPFSAHADEEFNWLLQCLGFFEPIDKGKTAASVFKELVKATGQLQQGGGTGNALSSSEIAKRVNMSRGAVTNHLNNLHRSGLILKEGSKFRARSKSMLRTVKELQDEIDLVFKKMEETAKELDKEMDELLRE